MNFRSLLSGTALAGFLFAIGLVGSAHAQAVTDDWASVKMPEAPEVKPVTIDPKNTALIVMDFNKAGCSQERRPRCVVDLPHVAELLKAAREHHLLVIHTLAGTTTAADIPDILKPAADEQVFKAGPDKFINSDLDKMLKEKGITNLITVGTAANGAALHTASGAAMRGYKVIVPLDGIPGDSPFTEAYSAWHMTHAPASAGNITLTKTDMVKFSSAGKRWILIMIATDTALAPLTLAKAPTRFFMTLRDIAFWVRSARADASLARLRQSSEVGSAFDQLYGATHDPYGATLPQFRYQRQKYETLISMLPLRPYREVLDIGCGLGTFARCLSPHAERILAIDISEAAITGARRLSQAQDNIEYRQSDLESFTGHEGRFDLVVLADTLYYLSPLTDEVVDSIAQRMTELLAPGGLLMLVNHFFFAIDPPSRMTRRIHDRFIAAPGLKLQTEHRKAFYLASIFGQA